MWDLESDVGLADDDFKQLNSSIREQQEAGRSPGDCHAEYVQQVKQKLQAKGLEPDAVIQAHKGLMYYAAVLDPESFETLWKDVEVAAAAAAPQEGEDEKDIWDAPPAEGENDDEDGYD